MKRIFFALLFLLLGAGCASSDRMVRMSGGILDEYSVPKSSRLRSEKYQKVSRELDPVKKSSRPRVATLDDTLINIWPFFFRNNDYWSILWPLVDSDPYGFAFRPFYNQEGDERSIFFPLSAWNPVEKSGWVTLFAWRNDAFGLLPLSWQYREKYSGGAYYTPLFIYNYNKIPFEYTPIASKNAARPIYVRQVWRREERSLWVAPFYSGCRTYVEPGDQQWLFDLPYRYRKAAAKAEWDHRMQGKLPFPATEWEMERYRQKIFASLPVKEANTYGFLPFWFGTFDDNGDTFNRFLLLAGTRKDKQIFAFDILGEIFFRYRKMTHPYSRNRWNRSRKEWKSRLFLAHFETRENYADTGIQRKLHSLYSLQGNRQDLARKKPELLEALRALDPAIQLPETVTDNGTLKLFLDELAQKYVLPTENTYSGRMYPFFLYETGGKRSFCVLPLFLTWWRNREKSSSFNSIPLLTFISRSPREGKTTVLSPLVYYAKERHRERSDYRILPREKLRAGKYDCVHIRDRYALCGLFYKGRFQFNVAREKVDAKTADLFRVELRDLPLEYKRIMRERESLEKDRKRVERWLPKTRIDSLKKEIQKEEWKIREEKWKKRLDEFRRKVETALAHGKNIGFTIPAKTFEKEEEARKALQDFMEKYTESRSYEDIGSGLFFHRQQYHNGDHKWHFLHLLAGGERSGSKESTHILHLLYRSRKDGDSMEKVFFPFISHVTKGEDYKWSFLWRFLSFGKKDGKTRGHILFIPFGEK